MKYAWIAAQQGEHGVDEMCRVLNVSESGYRAWQRGGKAERKRLTYAQMLARNQEHVICQGDKCLVIKESMSKSNYFMECAGLILQKAKEELNDLTRELGPADAPSSMRS